MLINEAKSERLSATGLSHTAREWRSPSLNPVHPDFRTHVLSSVALPPLNSLVYNPQRKLKEPTRSSHGAAEQKSPTQKCSRTAGHWSEATPQGSPNSLLPGP